MTIYKDARLVEWVRTINWIFALQFNSNNIDFSLTRIIHQLIMEFDKRNIW